MLDCVQGSQERLENQVTHLPTRIRKEPCSTNGDVNALLSAQGFIAPSPKFACDETIFLSGSIQDAMLSLKSLCPDIHQIFSTPQIDSQDQSGIPDELSKWFQAQFHTILKDIFEDSVYPLCPPLPPPSHDWDSRFHASRYLRRRNPSPKGMQPSDIFNKVLRGCQYSTSLYFETPLIKLDGKIIMLTKALEMPPALGMSCTWSAGQLFFLPASGVPLLD